MTTDQIAIMQKHEEAMRTKNDQPIMPIARHLSGKYLLRDIRGTSWGRNLHAAPPQMLIHWMVAPVALAKAIASLAPRLVNKERLRIVIGGAAFLDTFDRGAWYGMVPWLLGNPKMQIDVFLVGPDAHMADAKHPSGYSLSNTTFAPKEFSQAAVHIGSLSSFVATVTGDMSFDALMLFNPGFSAHMEWYDEPVIKDWLARDIPVLCASQSVDDSYNDLYVAGFHGIGSGQTTENPFSLGNWLAAERGPAQTLIEARTTFAETLWRLQAISPIPHPNLPQLKEACSRVHERNCRAQGSNELMLRHAARVGKLGQVFIASEIVGAEALDSQPVIVLEEGCLLLPISGVVYSTRHCRYVSGVKVPPYVISAYPDLPNDEYSFPAQLFAEWVWHESVLPVWAMQ